MIHGADAIVVGTVETTDGTNAIVKVVEVLKGSPGKTRLLGTYLYI